MAGHSVSGHLFLKYIMSRPSARGLLFYFEGEFFLGKITKDDHQRGCKDFAHGRIEVQPVYKQLHQEIVEQNADAYEQEITEQLHPAADIRLRKYHVLAQQEACGKSHRHRHKQGRDVRADINKREMNHLLL